MFKQYQYVIFYVIWVIQCMIMEQSHISPNFLLIFHRNSHRELQLSLIEI